MRFGPAFSSPAFSSHATWSHVFQSAFSIPAFSVAPWLIGHSMNFSIGNKLVPPYAQQPSRSPLSESTDTPASILETANIPNSAIKSEADTYCTVSHLPKPRFVASKTVCLDSYGGTRNCTAAEDVWTTFDERLYVSTMIDKLFWHSYILPMDGNGRSVNAVKLSFFSAGTRFSHRHRLTAIEWTK